MARARLHRKSQTLGACSLVPTTADEHPPSYGSDLSIHSSIKWRIFILLYKKYNPKVYLKQFLPLLKLNFTFYNVNILHGYVLYTNCVP